MHLASSRFVDDVPKQLFQRQTELSINEGTLGNWVAAYRRDHADEELALDVSERARLREAERLVRELKMENEFLKKVIMPAGAGTLAA